MTFDFLGVDVLPENETTRGKYFFRACRSNGHMLFRTALCKERLSPFGNVIRQLDGRRKAAAIDQSPLCQPLAVFLWHHYNIVAL